MMTTCSDFSSLLFIADLRNDRCDLMLNFVDRIDRTVRRNNLRSTHPHVRLSSEYSEGCLEEYLKGTDARTTRTGEAK